MEELSFENMKLAYKPYLRPKGLEEMLHRAYSINPRHREEFQSLKRLFHVMGEGVADELIKCLLKNAAIDDRFGTAEMARVRALLVIHMRNVVSGRFDAAYLATLEDFALLLARHNASLLWISGAYHDLSTSFMDMIVTNEIMNNAVLRRHAYRALATWMAVETGQIGRVFSEYARLLRHEARAGIRPGLPKGDAGLVVAGGEAAPPSLADRLRRTAAEAIRSD